MRFIVLLGLLFSAPAVLGQPLAPISFRNDVQPLLTRLGCSSVQCHGSPAGKAGLRLSLGGDDALHDHVTLTRDVLGRRANVVDADASLIFAKGMGKTTHGGGVRFREGSAEYVALRRWLTEGATLDERAAPCVKLVVSPLREVILKAPGGKSTLKVTATYSDGKTRDVTGLSLFISSGPEVAEAAPDGTITAIDRGEAAVTIRYAGQLETVFVTVTKDVPEFVWKAAPPVNFVDERVQAKLKQLGYLPAELCSDDVFLRCVSLDVVGVLPEPVEVRKFLADNDPKKREKLIDQLLKRPEHAKYWAQQWGDLLQLTVARMGKQPALAYSEWIEKALADNMTADRFARELLTGSGNTKAKPQANFYRMGEDYFENMEAAAVVFLGVQIQCAKCHNHPYERWTRNNYHGLTAFFHRIERQGAKVKNAEDVTIVLAPYREVKHPETGKVISPWLPGADFTLREKDDPREKFASWLTAKDNPHFARVEANRMWSWVMGRGLVEPTDDFRDSNPPANPELLDALAREFIKSGFDRRALLRDILVSRTYQAASRPGPFNESATRYFARYQPRKLTAEQLLDLISHFTGVREEFKNLPVGTLATQLPAPDVVEHEFLRYFGQAPRSATCQCERPSESNLLEALTLYNGRIVNDKLRGTKSRIQQAIREKKPNIDLVEELYLAAYCRLPQPDESAALLKYLVKKKGDIALALEDIVWAMINTNEFLYQH